MRGSKAEEKTSPGFEIFGFFHKLDAAVEKFIHKHSKYNFLFLFSHLLKRFDVLYSTMHHSARTGSHDKNDFN